MKVRDVMTRDVVTVRPETPFREVAKELLEHDISGVPVVDAGGRLLGMISEADLVSKEAYAGRPPTRFGTFVAHPRTPHKGIPRKAAGKFARDLMTLQPATATPDEEVRAVAKRLLVEGYKRLAVVEDDRLVGIVSMHDVLHVFARPDDELQREVQGILQGLCDAFPAFDVTVTVDQGVVTLEGKVTYAHHAQEIEAAVLEIDGVTGLTNRLTSDINEFAMRTPLWPV